MSEIRVRYFMLGVTIVSALGLTLIGIGMAGHP
jgi:hypothetical protein